MRRFLVLAIPLLVLVLAVGSFVGEELGYAPVPGSLLAAGSGLGSLPGAVAAGTWVLEALGLTALFLLIYGRGSGRVFAGLTGSWIAWVFRGPLVVLTVAGAAHLPPRPWWRAAVVWWVLYTVCGIVLALLAGRLERPAAAPQPPA